MSCPTGQQTWTLSRSKKHTSVTRVTKEALVRQRERVVRKQNDMERKIKKPLEGSTYREDKSKIEIERPTQNIGDSRVVTRRNGTPTTERETAKRGCEWTIHRPQLSRSM